MIVKNNTLITLVFLSVCFYVLVVPDIAIPQTPSGVVIVAHGSNNPNLDCNPQVNDLYNQLSSDPSLPPIQVAFLRYDNGKTLHQAALDLQIPGGDNNILFVHLAPSSFSIRHRELIKSKTPDPPGLVQKPWLHKKEIQPHPLPGGINYAVSRAMDDNYLIVQILSDYAQQTFDNLPSPLEGGLPKTKENVSLLLVSYGAIEEIENILWDRVMEEIGETIRSQRGFRDVACVSLRNHSADLIKEQAVRDLIKTAKRLKEQGEVIAVPYVICDGAFHDSLKSYIGGIVSDTNICSKGVITHPNTAEWVKEVIAQGMNQPPGREVNRNWSLMDIEKGDPKGTNKYGFCE